MWSGKRIVKKLSMTGSRVAAGNLSSTVEHEKLL